MRKEKEEWRPIRGFEGLYEVSDYCRVKSLARMKKGNGDSLVRIPERILKQKIGKNGYREVTLCKNGKHTTKTIHRIVWETFKGEIPAGMQVNHIDENKLNNSLENLNLMTPKENVNWGTGIERCTKARSKPVVACNPETMEIVYEFPSTCEAGRNGFTQRNVSNASRGCYKREGNHTYKKLNWYYK